MRKMALVLIGLVVLCGVAMAYTTQSTFETGTVTSGARAIIKPAFMVENLLIINDSTTAGYNIYVNWEGDLSAALMTTEAFVLEPGEWIRENNCRTRRIYLLAAGTAEYRIYGSGN